MHLTHVKASCISNTKLHLIFHQVASRVVFLTHSCIASRCITSYVTSSQYLYIATKLHVILHKHCIWLQFASHQILCQRCNLCECRDDTEILRCITFVNIEILREMRLFSKYVLRPYRNITEIERCDLCQYRDIVWNATCLKIQLVSIL